MVKTLHARRHRGDPRRGLQPHGRRQPARARRSRSAASTTPSTTGWPDDRRYYVDYTGMRQHAVHRSIRIVLRLIFDSLRYWVTEMHVDGFRFDLATTLAREQHAFDPTRRVLRHRAPGPGAVAGEADRRAMGPRRRRLPGRRISARLVRVERPLSRRRALLLERRRRAGRRAREPALRVERHLRARRPRARRRRSTSSPRTTASRCATSSATTTSTTKRTARTTATANRTTAAGTAASKARPTIPGIRALRLRQMRNFLATLFFSQGVPMLLAGDEIGRTQHGNNNAYCQDNEISWLRLGPRRRRRVRCSTSPAGDCAAQQASAVPPPHVFPRPRGARLGREGHRVAASPRRAR